MTQTVDTRLGWPSTRYSKGELLTPGQARYDEARAIFNARLTGRPAAIARCTGVADVREALRYAEERDLEVSVRSGGHGVAGWSTNDGGLVIDLSPMRWVHVDPRNSTAWIGGGALAGDAIREAAEFALAPVTGVQPEIGVAGLVLGIGEGYLTPKHGFGADNVLEVELITADGSVLQVSADEHPELFWALRGAGANFGVATALRLRLYPAPEHAVGGSITFAGEDAPQLTRHVWDMMENASEFAYPEIAYVLDGAGSLEVVAYPGHTGSPELAEREIGALRACAAVKSDRTRAMSYLELTRDRTDTYGDPVPVRLAWDLYRFEFGAQPERQMQVLLEQARELIPSTAFILWRTVPKELAAPGSAVPRLPGITMCVLAHWQRPEDDEDRLAWMHRLAGAFRSAGVVREAANAMNHVTLYEHDRVKSLYGEAAYRELARLKRRFDPQNRFRRNYNIPPA